MRKNSLAVVLLAIGLVLPLAACQDTKARQENDQLKAQVAQLTKENSDLTTRVDGLAKENSDLSAENEKLKAQIPHPKKKAAAAKKKRKRAHSSS
jgi:regulator of replication initiation timing